MCSVGETGMPIARISAMRPTSVLSTTVPNSAQRKKS
jgi:hypothetical protein